MRQTGAGKPKRYIRPYRGHLVRRRTSSEAIKRELGINRWVALWAVPILIIAICIAAMLKTRPSEQTQYRTVDTPFVNPLSGWVPRAEWPVEEMDPSSFSMVLVEVPWRELEREQGVYRFDDMEEKYQMAKWHSLGKRIVLSVVADRPKEVSQRDIPDWLYEEMEGAGAEYDGEMGKGFAPEYMHPAFVHRHWELLQALGNRYDKDIRIAYVMVGSIGHSGRWGADVEGGAPPLGLDALTEEFIWHYYSVFDATKLLLPRPFFQGEIYGMGLYNANFADEDASWDWLGEVGLGGRDIVTGASLKAVPEAWKDHPVGAVLSNTDLIAQPDIGLSAILRQIREGHVSFIIGDYPREAADNLLSVNLRRAQHTMGYRLWVERARWVSALRIGERLVMKASWRNDGVAPMYYAWPVELSLLDDEGRIVHSAITRVDIRRFLPGSTRALMEMDIPLGLPAGSYTICVAILDPSTREPGVRLAMQSEREDLRYPLGPVRVGR